jgi:hypothetical protein
MALVVAEAAWSVRLGGGAIFEDIFSRRRFGRGVNNHVLSPEHSVERWGVGRVQRIFATVGSDPLVHGGSCSSGVKSSKLVLA